MANILSYGNTAATSATITVTGSQRLDILASARATVWEWLSQWPIVEIDPAEFETEDVL